MNILETLRSFPITHPALCIMEVPLRALPPETEMYLLRSKRYGVLINCCGLSNAGLTETQQIEILRRRFDNAMKTLKNGDIGVDNV